MCCTICNDCLCDVCGDDVCEGCENATNCAADCGGGGGGGGACDGATTPTASISGTPTAGDDTNSTSASFTFSCTGGSTATPMFMCALDATPTFDDLCTASWSETGITAGDHTFYMYCSKCGKQSTTKSRSWTVDLTAPSGGSVAYAGYLTTTSQTVTYTIGSDAGSGLNLSTGQLQRASAALAVTCGSYGVYTTIATETDGSYADSALANAKCYKYKYVISDNAGNQASYTSTSVTKVDTGDPGITATKTPAANAAGWNKADVTVSYACSDAVSGIVINTCPADDSVASETTTSGTTFGRSVSDNAGNSASVSTTVKLDKTAPVDGSISYTGGYYTAASVAVTYTTGTDALSGLKTSTGQVQRNVGTLSAGSCSGYGGFATRTSGTGTGVVYTDTGVASGKCYQYRYVISDNADNQVIYSPGSEAKVDTEAPTISAAVSPTPNAAGWNKADVTVTYTCGDTGGSGLSGSCPASDSRTTNTTGTVYNRSVSDKAGNSASVSTTVKLDKTAPSVSITSPVATGGTSYTPSSSIDVSGTAADTGGSAIKSVKIGGTTCTGTASWTCSGIAVSAGSNTVTATVTDNADNTASASITVIRDNVNPTDVSVSASPAAPTDAQAITLSASASDTNGISNIKIYLDGAEQKNCVIALTSPASCSVAIGTKAVGSYDISATAADAAGNLATASGSFSVTSSDNTPPETTITSNPSSVTNATSATFSFSCEDNVGGSGCSSTFYCNLDGGGWTACTTPKTYPGLTVGSHTFEVYAQDNNGNVDASPASHVWIIETTAPTVSIVSPTNGSSTKLTTIDVTGTASDANGVASISIGGAGCVSSDGFANWTCLGVALASEGANTVTATAVDGAGNSGTASITVNRDTTKPNTAILSKDPSVTPTSSTGMTFTFNSPDDAGATFQCKLDVGVYAACTSPRSYSSLAVGSHTFYVRAKDAVGNFDASPATYAWTVDTSAPDTTITAQPNDPTNTASGNFSFTSSETGSTFECKVDGAAAWSSCASPKNVTGAGGADLSEAAHTFEVRAIDAAGNIDPTPAAYVWTVDYTKPITTIDRTRVPESKTSSTEATIYFTCNETCSQFMCWHDNDPFVTCASPWTKTGLTSGTHRLRVKAVDAAGNWEMTDEYEWEVDSVAPETTILEPKPADPTNDDSPTFFFESNEPGSTFVCQLDGGASTACVSPQSYPALGDSSHVFTVQATDAVGNSDLSPATHNWTIDTVPPETTLVAVPPPVTPETYYSFTYYAESPDEFTASFQCELDSAGWAPCPSGGKSVGLLPDAPLANGGHFFKVRAIDRAGNPDPTPASHSWIVDAEPPLITPCCGTLGDGGSEFVFARTPDSVTLRWTTNEPADGYADYDLTTDYFSWAGDPENPTLKVGHALTVGGLWPDTPYFFRVSSTDLAGNTALVCDAGTCIFRTEPQPDLIPPGEITDVSYLAGDQWVQINWTNPTDADFDRLVARRGLAGDCPAEPDQGTGIALSGPQATSLTDTDVVNGVAYCYSIFAYDSALPINNHSAGYRVDNVRPSVFAITDPLVTDPNARTASFSWGTTEPAQSYLFYGASPTALIPANSGNPVLAPYVITGLMPGIKYYWYVRAVSSFDGKIAQTVLMDFVKGSPTPAGGSGGGNVTGWWWSATVGWISLNCDNFGTCPTSKYGVSLKDVPAASGTRATIDGFAWSETLGWICVGASCTDPTPEGDPSYAEWSRFVVDGTPEGRHEQLYGWAQVMALGADGWISLNCYNLTRPDLNTCATSDHYVVFGPDGYFHDLSDPINRYRNHYAWSGNAQGTGIGWVDTSLSFANWAPSRLGRVRRPWGIYEPTPTPEIPGGEASHPSTFSIAVTGIYAPPYSFLECRLQKPNGTFEFISLPLGEDAMRDAAETLVYTVPPQFNDQQTRDIEQNRLWYIDSCYLGSVTTEYACNQDADCPSGAICDEIAGLCREILFASARKPLFTHFNQWTLFGASDDFYQAVKCYASFPDQYFRNPKRCDFTGDASMSMAMSKGMPVERQCDNVDAFGNPVDDDNNGQANCDDRFCQGIAYFCQKHLPTRCVRGSTGGTIGDCTGVGYQLGNLCCGDQPVALGAGFNQIIDGLECAYQDPDDGYFDCDCTAANYGQTADCFEPGHQAGEFCCTFESEVSKE